MAALLSTFLLASIAAAQFVNQEYHSRNLTLAQSPTNHNVTIAYKEPHGVCKTAFPSQKQYAGWVNVPADYPTNLFFWFVEAREKTDQLTIWLNGGPGFSSMYGFFSGNGPCAVVEKGLNQYDTVAREWGWDRGSNLIFIDQPNQVGFSYDVPSNRSILFTNRSTSMPPQHHENTKNKWDLANGTFSSMDIHATSNTTQTAAFAVWHMLQAFLAVFPQYLPPEPKPVSVNLFSESYGGRYGPIFADIWDQQNQLRQTAPASVNSTREIALASLGILNGCVDLDIQTALSPAFATANTYGFKAFSDETAKFYTDKFNSASGCAEKIRRCVQLSQTIDPNDMGNVQEVNAACHQNMDVCGEIDEQYLSSGRSLYDLASPYHDPFPPYTFVDYLNQASTQAALGSPINYTTVSDAVFYAFLETGDIYRGQTIPRIARLLNKGIRVGLVYGDRDYICNWFGGEAVSLQIARAAGGLYLDQFPKAGYSPIIVNSSYIGGEVRQFGNLSFSRVFQAGHSISSYQPETAFQIFYRLLQGTSVSTGQNVNLDTYSTSGPINSTTKAKLPKMPDSVCYVRAFQETCDEKAQSLVDSGDGVVINGVLYSSSADWPLMSPTPTSSNPDTETSTTILTGAFTATATPKSSTVNARAPTAYRLVVLVFAALLDMI